VLRAVIGNSAYQSTTPLANPSNDARDMATALRAAGFSVIEALDADKHKLDSALRVFADQLSRADVALFFYAGHGLQVGLQNYLVPNISWPIADAPWLDVRGQMRSAHLAPGPPTL
jgi:uncharacterized caspase-like protein